jgi:carbamoyl-phosphate synthase large subunit
LIDEFAPLRAQAERMAAALGSTGPLNIQGRVRQGVLLPFEINPRFCASDYLRALAGCNQPDIFLQYLAYGTVAPPQPLRPGYYLRSLSEIHVRPADVAK